jgi:hypothetical protein
MKNNFVVFMLLFALVQSKCTPVNVSTSQEPTPDVSIFVPTTCTLVPNGKITLSLHASILPPGSKILWDADHGTVKPNDKPMVQYTAPDYEGIVVINVTVTAPEWVAVKTTTCIVSLPKTEVPIGPAVSPEPIKPSDTPTFQVTPILEGDNYSIAITEILGNPCGDDDEYVNVYVELYNYGDHPVDVSGLFLTTTGQNGESDKIVSWSERSLSPFANDLIFNTGILQPKQFGVVLSPKYPVGPATPTPGEKMPYFFPPNTVILTIEKGNLIGNKLRSIYTDGKPYDAVLLYEGRTDLLKDNISTYGLDDDIDDLKNLYTHRVANLPLQATKDCSSVERINATGQDVEQNWHLIIKGNPGNGPYE